VSYSRLPSVFVPARGVFSLINETFSRRTSKMSRPIGYCGSLALPAFALPAPRVALLPRAAQCVAWRPRGGKTESREEPQGHKPVALQLPSFLLGATHGTHLRTHFMMVRGGKVARACMGVEGTLYLSYSYLLFVGVGRLLLLPP
jgi:hypothetical protein